GNLDAHDFLAFYVKDGRVLAVAGMNREREMAVFEELFRLDRMPPASELRDGSKELAALLAEGASTSRQGDPTAGRAA
ncbi:MAG TPA: oxidoreductase C-terminal domain-containing protein, partial [Pyrinomonadaceae bacterium]